MATRRIRAIWRWAARSSRLDCGGTQTAQQPRGERADKGGRDAGRLGGQAGKAAPKGCRGAVDQEARQEPLRLQEPCQRGPSAQAGAAIVIAGHWDRADIEVRRGSAIQADFSLAGVAAFGGTSEVNWSVEDPEMETTRHALACRRCVQRERQRRHAYRCAEHHVHRGLRDPQENPLPDSDLPRFLPAPWG